MELNRKAVISGVITSTVSGLILNVFGLGIIGPFLGGVVSVFVVKEKDMNKTTRLGYKVGFYGSIVEGILLALFFRSITASIIGLSDPFLDASVMIIAISLSMIFGIISGILGAAIGSAFVRQVHAYS